MKITDKHVTMTKRAFVHEHEHLVDVLQKRQHKSLNAEAKEQGEELAKVKASK